MMDPALLDLLRQRVTIEPYTGEDFYGAPEYGDPEEHQARVKGEVRMVRAPDGTEKVSSTVAWVAKGEGFDLRSRVTLPDGSTPLPLAIETVPDESGAVHHIKVRFA